MTNEEEYIPCFVIEEEYIPEELKEVLDRLFEDKEVEGEVVDD